MLEGFGYKIRYGAEVGAVNDLQRIWYTAGGGVLGTAWCQIVSDIVGRTQAVNADTDGAIGGALIAGHVAALFDLETIIEQRNNYAHLYKPQAHLRDFYDKRYKRYMYISRLLKSYQ